ncbi:MAG: EamA/RhaT family transporter [Deltaproteobacteria bacterium]|nr:MAG: EamA/RhaT family transporter [Deltaproteobacteria bacterium]
MRAAVLAVAAAALLWSSGGLFIKLAPMPAMAVACGRSLIAGVFYLALLRPNLRNARWSTAAAYAGCIITFVTATKLTTAANAIFLQYTAPAYVLLLSPFVLRERLRPIDLACVILSLLGLSLFFVDKVEPGQTLGNILGIVSGIFFALNIVLLRRDQGDALASMTLGNLVAAAVTLPFALGSLPALLTPLGAGVLLYLGIVQLGLAYWLFARGVRLVPAAEASIISMLEPIFNPIWVLLFWGERPGPWAVAGGVVVIASVALRTVRPAEAFAPDR